MPWQLCILHHIYLVLGSPSLYKNLIFNFFPGINMKIIDLSFLFLFSKHYDPHHIKNHIIISDTYSNINIDNVIESTSFKHPFKLLDTSLIEQNIMNDLMIEPENMSDEQLYAFEDKFSKIISSYVNDQKNHWLLILHSFFFNPGSLFLHMDKRSIDDTLFITPYIDNADVVIINHLDQKTI